jgi:hypothetical protein
VPSVISPRSAAAELEAALLAAAPDVAAALEVAAAVEDAASLDAADAALVAALVAAALDGAADVVDAEPELELLLHADSTRAMAASPAATSRPRLRARPGE